MTTCEVETTQTQVIVYKNGKVVGRAGVQRKEDFDLDALLKIAVAKGDLTNEEAA